MTAEDKSKLLIFALIGRIDGQRQHNQNFYTRVTAPAPDEYSMPSQFEIRSTQPLGPIGQEFKGKIRVSGFVKDRQYTDRNTGEIKIAADKTVIFDLVLS